MRLGTTAFICLLLLLPVIGATDGIQLKIVPGSPDAPLRFSCARPFAESRPGMEGTTYVAVGSDGQNEGLAQISSLGPSDWRGAGGCWMAVFPLRPPLGDTSIFLPGQAESPFTFAEGERTLSLTEENLPVLDFNFGMMLKAGVPEDRRRACYFHPVFDLDGNVITDDFPDDHHHHRGMAWMWPGVWYGEKRVDEWHIKGVHQKFVRWLGRDAGPVCAVLGIEVGWFLDDGTRMAEEVSWYRVFRKSEAGRAIDVHYTLKALDQPVKIQGTLAQDKGYGGFCFRYAPRTDTTITTPEGRAAKDSDRLPYPWVDFSARFAGSDSYSGAAIFVHPSHPGYPNGWTIRHYGFLGVAWPGLEIVTLDPGESFTLQYRVWIHRGDVQEGMVEAAWSEFILPPEPIADLTREK